MSSRIVIVGNGFDLEHGIETSFESYLTWFIKNRQNPSFIWWDKIFGSILLNALFENNENQINKFTDVAKVKTNKFIYAKLKSDDEWLLMKKILSDKNWFNLESFIGNYAKRILLKIKSNINKIARNNHWNLMLIQRHWSIQLWLESFYNEKLSKITIKPYEGTFGNHDQFISFNYTTTLEDVYNISRNQILYIHGRINSLETPMFACSSGFLSKFVNSKNSNQYRVIEKYFGKFEQYKFLAGSISNNRKPSIFILGCNLKTPEIIKIPKINLDKYEESWNKRFKYLNLVNGDGVFFTEFFKSIDKHNGIWINYNENDLDDKKNKEKFYKLVTYISKYAVDEHAVNKHVVNNTMIKKIIIDEPGGK